MEVSDILPIYAGEIKEQPNVKVLSQSAERMTYQIDCSDGSGTVEVLTLFPGIVMQFHSFHCKSFYLSESKDIGNGLKINFCSQGRMEVRMSDNLFLFLEPGNMSIDERKAQDSFNFPCGHYHGVEILFHYSTMNQDAPALFQALDLSPELIQERFCSENHNYIIRTDDRIKTLFQSMIEAPAECRLQYLRIKTAELLCLLSASQMPLTSDDSSFMTMGQVEIAKQVMEILTTDLSRHYSVENLARPFGISPSSLKNYFQGVYGKNISTFMRETRMSAAALALQGSNQPVSEIAFSIGYENASKFSSAFKKFIGESPLEYRRQSRCGI